MDDALELVRAGGGGLVPVQLADAARAYASASLAETTRYNYRLHFGRFLAWCEEHGFRPLPATPEAVALYLAHLAQSGMKAGTIGLALTAIDAAHTLADHERPGGTRPVRQVMRGIRRELGVAPKQAAPILPDALKAMVRAIDDGSPRGARDAAMLTIGWAGALRRSELLALEVGDIEERDEGLALHLRRSKTDQEGRGTLLGLPFMGDANVCPVRRWRKWCQVLGRTDGPAFVAIRGAVLDVAPASGRAVDRAIKRAAQRAGLEGRRLSAHSLRAGRVSAPSVRRGAGLTLALSLPMSGT